MLLFGVELVMLDPSISFNLLILIQAFRRLSILQEERGDAYTNANAKVCLGSMK